MKLLDRHLTSQFAKHFLTIAIGFVSLYLLIDFFEKIDNFNNAGKSTGLVIQYFTFNIPFVVDQLSPILILLAGVITLGILNHNNELVALKAGGIPLKQIVKPIIIAGLGTTILFLATAQFILPHTIAITNNIWFEQVKKKIQLGIYRNGRYYFRGKEGFYSFEWEDKEEMSFKNFSYSKWNDKHKLQLLLSAQEAFFQESEWIFRNGQTQSMKQGEFKTVPFKELHQTLPENPIDFLIPQYDFAALSITDLFMAAHNQESKKETIKAWAEFYGRISYILLGLPLLLIGLPILLLTYMKWGKDLSIAIPISCGIAFFAWGVWEALQSLAIAGIVSPILAGTVIHVIFSSVGLYLLHRQNQ